MHWLSTDYSSSSGWGFLAFIGIIAIIGSIIAFLGYLSDDWRGKWHAHWHKNIAIVWGITFIIGGVVFSCHMSGVNATIIHELPWSAVSKLNITYWHITKQEGEILTVESNMPAKDMPASER